MKLTQSRRGGEAKGSGAQVGGAWPAAVHRRLASLGVAPILVAGLLATTLLGCQPEPPSSAGNVAGARDPQAAPSAPAGVDTSRATAVAMPSPGPTASSTRTSGASAIPEAISRSLSDPYANVDWFQGVATVTTSQGRADPATTIVRQWFKQPGMVKLEIVRSSVRQTTVGTNVVYDGRKLTIYEPGADRLFEIREPVQAALFLNLPQQRLLSVPPLVLARQFISSVANEATATLSGGETVANRSTTIVDLAPKRPSPRLGGVRLWLDKQTVAPLRIEVRGADGSPVISIEYTQFDPVTAVSDDAFAFKGPSNLQATTPALDELAISLGYQSTTAAEAEARAGFPVLRPGSLPASLSQQAIGYSSVQDSPVVALFYGTGQGISTVLIERSTVSCLPVPWGTETVTKDGFPADLHETEGVAIVDWVRGDRGLTLVSTLPRDQALEIARSVQ